MAKAVALAIDAVKRGESAEAIAALEGALRLLHGATIPEGGLTIESMVNAFRADAEKRGAAVAVADILQRTGWGPFKREG